MTPGPILVTGFEPYGGRTSNPALAAMQAVDGMVIDGINVVGRPLPVAIAAILSDVEALHAELRPSAMIGLGLWPGEAAIRLERIGINLADFEIADNQGSRLRDDPVLRHGAEARFTTLPVRAIETALLEADIPVHLSATAGTFLCNACLYSLLEIAERHPPPVPCGFIHVPYTPGQVAEMLRQARGRAEPEAPRRVDLPSMELSRTIDAVRIALGVVTAQLAMRPPSSSSM